MISFGSGVRCCWGNGHFGGCRSIIGSRSSGIGIGDGLLWYNVRHPERQRSEANWILEYAKAMISARIDLFTISSPIVLLGFIRFSSTGRFDN